MTIIQNSRHWPVWWIQIISISCCMLLSQNVPLHPADIPSVFYPCGCGPFSEVSRDLRWRRRSFPEANPMPPETTLIRSKMIKSYDVRACDNTCPFWVTRDVQWFFALAGVTGHLIESSGLVVAAGLWMTKMDQNPWCFWFVWGANLPL